MLYQRKSFSVASRNLSSAMCKEKGHSGTDSRGCCYACGEKISASAAQLAAITHEYLDEPAPKTDLELVQLEGGPAGDLLAPITALHQIAHTTIYTMEFGTQVLWYRSIGLDTDRPRIFAFDGFSRGP